MNLSVEFMFYELIWEVFLLEDFSDDLTLSRLRCLFVGSGGKSSRRPSDQTLHIPKGYCTTKLISYGILVWYEDRLQKTTSYPDPVNVA